MLNPLDLTGQTVVVTGASSGIGRETAILLSELGAGVVLVGRNPARLAESLEQLHGSGHSSEVFDLTRQKEIPEWLSRVATRTGALSGLVHCAGMHSRVPLRVLEAAHVEEVFQVNVNAAFSLIKGFRQRGVCRPEGSVVLVGSIAGLVGQAGVSAYAATKGALVALTRALAIELAPQGLRVNCVAPGLVKTEMAEEIRRGVGEDQFLTIVRLHPLGLGEARDVAHAIAFLLARTGRWITGSVVVVDGGYTAH